MAQGKQGVIHASTEGGVVGKQATTDPFQFFVGPTTSNEFNTARLRLIPIACFSVEDASFKFDSSFVLPEFQTEINHFINLREKDPDRIKGAPISIFGHADPSFQGNFELSAPTHQAGDDYNKVLSGRRAIAMYALLIRDAAIWNNLFTNHFGADVWGEDSIRTMLDAVDPPKTGGGQQGPSQSTSGQGQSSSSSSDPNPGATDSARAAKVRSIAHDPGQRQQLFLKYMDLICGDLKLDKTKDFLARGAGPDHKGDVQGCGRFNPRLLFSSEKESQFKKAALDKDEGVLGVRNADNSPNRRVMILIFRKGSQVLPAKWPCPTFKEGSAGCRKRFFSDGDQRRATHLPGTDKKFDDTHDTFACRFYQRISDQSPCEAYRRTLRIWLLDDKGKRSPVGTPYRLTVGAQVRNSRLKIKGLLIEGGIIPADEAIIEWSEYVPDDKQGNRNQEDDRLRRKIVKDDPDHPFLEGTPAAKFSHPVFDFSARIFLNTEHSELEDDSHTVRRLRNMGYPTSLAIPESLDEFAGDYELKPDDPDTQRVKLRDFHRDGTEMPLKTIPDLSPIPPELFCGNDKEDV